MPATEGRSSFRAWLYRIATNACLDALAHAARRVLPHHLRPPSDPTVVQAPVDLAWLQPYPDRLLDAIALGDAEPAEAVVVRETIELAFLAAIQHLPPRQRAVLVLRDVLGWSARDTAELLETSVASANSALQRARATMKDQLPRRRLDWTRSSVPSEDERALLRRYMDAYEWADASAVAELLHEDVRATMPPHPMWFQGRDAIAAALSRSFDPTSPGYTGRFRMLPTGANRQPAVAAYVRQPGESEYRPFVLAVLRIEDGLIVEIDAFGPQPPPFATFGLPPKL